MRAHEFTAEKNHRKISEIVEIPSSSDDPEKYQIFFTDTTNTTTTSQFSNGFTYEFIKNVDQFGDEHYGLLRGKKLVAYLGLEHQRINRPQMTHISVHQNLRGLGLQRYLINQALQFHDEIYSDTRQTPESIYFWKMLMLYPEPKYKIYMYDADTQTRKSITKRPSLHHTHDESYGEIWNNEENPILVIVKNTTNTKTIEESRRIDAIRARWGKDDWTVWYGNYTRNSGYENP